MPLAAVGAVPIVVLRAVELAEALFLSSADDASLSAPGLDVEPGRRAWLLAGGLVGGLFKLLPVVERVVEDEVGFVAVEELVGRFAVVEEVNGRLGGTFSVFFVLDGEVGVGLRAASASSGGIAGAEVSGGGAVSAFSVMIQTEVQKVWGKYSKPDEG